MKGLALRAPLDARYMSLPRTLLSSSKTESVLLVSQNLGISTSIGAPRPTNSLSLAGGRGCSDPRGGACGAVQAQGAFAPDIRLRHL